MEKKQKFDKPWQYNVYVKCEELWELCYVSEFHLEAISKMIELQKKNEYSEYKIDVIKMENEGIKRNKISNKEKEFIKYIKENIVYTKFMWYNVKVELTESDLKLSIGDVKDSVIEPYLFCRNCVHEIGDKDDLIDHFLKEHCKKEMSLEEIDERTVELKKEFLKTRKQKKCPRCGKRNLDIEHYKNNDGIRWYICCQNTDCDEFHVTIHSI